MADNDKKMRTEPGGESTQYESIKTHTVPPAKQSGQLDSGSQPDGGAPVHDHGDKTAENIRYGQNISESGVGGFTNSTGKASQEGGYGGVARDKNLEQEQTDSRTAQGYGPSSGVGG